MQLKPFYSLAELARLADCDYRTIKAMLKRHNVRVTDTANEKSVVTLVALQEAIPDFYRSVVMAIALNKTDQD